MLVFPLEGPILLTGFTPHPRNVNMICYWMTEMNKWNVGILFCNDVEVLDFSGPFEVFHRTRLVPNVTSGIDMAFYVLETPYGREVADETARYIEFRRTDL